MDSLKIDPDSTVHGANMGPIWGRQDPGGPHVGPMNFAIWGDANSIAAGDMIIYVATSDDNARFSVF